MARKHGWQLPAHTSQVVAITAFCLLVIAFYAFLAPFLGGRIWEYILIATYSPVVLLVFILYVRCTAINPADPGTMHRFNNPHTTSKDDLNHGFSAKTLPRKFNETGSAVHSSPSSPSRSSIIVGNPSMKGLVEGIMKVDNGVLPQTRNFGWNVGGIFCALFVHEDCRKREGTAEQQGSVEDVLFCSLCDAEVRKFSKHCRSCDKCVDDFDHHCPWINNCVGCRNYVTFISLMVTSLVWLVYEAGVGIAVLVRCFVDKKSMDAEIVDTLGNGFSRAPFATVVAVCTAVSILASKLLGELLFFHMILIRKGLTTYEYIMAMRAMSDPGGVSVDEELPNILYSPSGSATTTGFSGGSWCTPPRVFTDDQDEVVPQLEPGMVPSTVDPDSERRTKVPKKPVRISAWKLAKLDSTEAMRAAARTRASSSVLKAVDNRRLPDAEYSSSSNLSRSSMNTDMGLNKEIKNDFRISQLGNSLAPSQGSRDEYETGTQSVSSFSSSGHIHESVTLSPLPQPQALGRLNPATSVPRFGHDLPVTSKTPFFSGNNPVSYPKSGFEEKMMQKGSSTDPLLLSTSATSLFRDMKRTSVVWDQNAGRYISVPVSASDYRNRSAALVGYPKPSLESNNTDRKQAIQPKETSSSSAAKAPAQQADKLMYAGSSIFFGGPLLSVTARDGLRSEGSSGLREGQQRFTFNIPPEARFKRDSASSQLPVFVPGGYSHKSSSGPGLRKS